MKKQSNTIINCKIKNDTMYGLVYSKTCIKRSSFE